MVIPYLRLFCLISVSMLLSVDAYADIYKWVDKDGQMHYAETPPADQQAQKIVTPPPPPIDPNQAQQPIDDLIMQQKADEQEQQQQQRDQAQTAEIEAQRKKNCEISRHNLQQYQDNPGRRMMDAQGNVTQLTEEMRQKKIEEMQQQIQQYCQ